MICPKVLTPKVIMLTGYFGTGKSTWINLFVDPTGRTKVAPAKRGATGCTKEVRMLAFSLARHFCVIFVHIILFLLQVLFSKSYSYIIFDFLFSSFPLTNLDVV